MRTFHAFSVFVAVIFSYLTAAGAEPKPVPRLQAIPLPHSELQFTRDGDELTRIHFGRDLRRPFVFPVNGPSGRSLTRMGHPRDPESHSHHNSAWISHQSVNGVSFWEDRGGRIEHLRILRIEDGDEFAFVETENIWKNPQEQPVLFDRRRVGVKALGNREWLLTLDLELDAKNGDVTLGSTPFGMIGVRMAKTIGVTDGGGTIRNSEGGVDEAGCFRKAARWIDYSGSVTQNAIEGIALFDHPENPHHPITFHCRDDGWMGASTTLPGELLIGKGEVLRVRYALYVHAGMPAVELIEKQWKNYSVSPWLEFLAKK